MAVNNLITLRKGIATEWSSQNPTLASGEPGYDGTNNILKIGDGATAWSALKEIGSFAELYSGDLDGAVVVECKNSTGATIPAGTPVYVSGYYSTNGKALISVAKANDSSKMPAIGLLESELANDTEGYVHCFGLADQLDSSSFSVGNTVYVHPTGGLTNTRPTGTNELVQNIGRVLRSDASQGKILILGPGRTNDVPNSGHFEQLTVDGYTSLAADGGKVLVGGSHSFSADGISSVSSASTTLSQMQYRLKDNAGGFTYIGRSQPEYSQGLELDGGASYFAGTAGDVLIATQESDNVKILTGGFASSNVRMTIDPIGKVGIGTASPSYKLDVKDGSTEGFFAGGVWYADHITGNGDSGFVIRSAENNKWSIQNDESEGDTFHIRSGGFGGSSRFKMTSSETVLNEDGNSVNFRVEGDADANLLCTDAITDRVGIGINSPTAKLMVYATGVSSFRVESASSYAYSTIKHNSSTQWGYLEFNNDSSNRAFVQQNGSANYNYGGPNALSIYNYAGPIVFGTNTTNSYIERMSINTAGNIVINEGGLNSDFRVEGYTDEQLLFTDASTDRVGIGMASPSYKLDVSGVGRFVHADGDCGLIVEDTGGGGVHIGDCAFGAGSTYAGMKHSSHTGSSEYMMISQGDHTFISAASGSPVIIRGGANNAQCEIRVYDNNDGENGVVINEGGFDRDTRIEGAGDPYVFHVDASADSVGIGTPSPSEKLDIRYPASGGMALIKDSDSNDGLLFGDMALSANNNYQGIKHPKMTGILDYMMISDGGDTYISSKDGSSTFIRAGANTTTYQIQVAPTFMAVGATAESMVINSAGVVFNEAGANRDFRVEGDTDQNLLFTDASTDRVGIGKASPEAKLHVSHDITYAGGGTSIAVFTDFNSAITANGTNYIVGHQIDARKNISTGVTDGGYIMGGDFIGVTEGAGTITHSYGIRTYAGMHTAGSGVVLNAYGVRSRVLNLGIGSITNGYGLYIDDVQATNGYGIYQIGSNDKNYFNGDVGIGTPSPSYKLEVNGDIGLTDSGFYASPTGVMVGTSGWLYNDGQTTLSHGNFSDNGDAQNSSYVLRTSTTNDTFTTIQNNASNVILASNRTMMFTANIVARRTNGQDNAAYKIEGVLVNDGYGASILGTPVKTILYESDSSWDVQAILSGGGYGASDYLLIQGKGAASKNVNWVCKLDLLEVGGDISGYTEANILNVKDHTIP